MNTAFKEDLLIWHKKDITLLECLLYMTFMAWLFSASMIMVSRTWRDCITISRKQRSSITLYSAYDLLVRDLQCAPSGRAAWKEITPTTLIWHSGGADIGWFVQDKSLIRAQGEYSTVTKKWKKKHANVIAQVDKVQFESGTGGRITQFNIVLSDEYTTITTDILLNPRSFT